MRLPKQAQPVDRESNFCAPEGGGVSPSDIRRKTPRVKLPEARMRAARAARAAVKAART